MASDIDVKITAGWDGSQAEKGAEKTGEKIQQALSVKNEDSGIKSMQKDLQVSVAKIEELNKELNASVETYKKRAGYAKLSAEYEEKTAQIAQLTADKLERQAINEKLAKDYKRNVDKWGAEHGQAKKYLEPMQRGAEILATINKELTTAEARAGTLQGLMKSLETRRVAYEVSTAPKMSEEERANKEQQIVELKAEQATLADEILNRETYLSDAVDKTLATEASSTAEFEKTAQAAEEVKDTVESIEEPKASDAWEEKTFAAKDSVSELKEEFDKTSESVEKTNEQLENDARAAALEKLNEQIRNLALNADTSKMSITELIRYLQQLNQVKSGIEKAGMPEAQSTYYELIIKQIANAQNAINAYKRELNGVKAESDRTSGSVRNLGKSFSSIGKSGTISFSTIRKGFSNLRSHIHKVKSAMDRLSKSFRRSFKHGLTNLTKYVLGFRSLYFLVRKLRNGVKEGLENLVQYNDTMNKTVRGHNLVDDAMSNLKTSLLYLKNAWAAAFSPILITVMPLLTKLIDFLAEAGNAVARFFATLFASITGVDTAYQAVKVDAGDYADGLDKSGGSAKKAADNQKKLNEQLGEYDKLLVIKSKNDDTPNSGSGGGSGKGNTPKVQDMFNTVKAKSNLADAITRAFDTDDWRGLGDRVATNVANAFDSIPWPTIQAKVQKGAEGTANFINGFLGNAHLWTSGGTAAAQALNTVSGAIVTFNNTIDPVLIGFNAAQGLRSFLLTTNWGQLGSAIGGFFTNVNKGLTTFLHNMPTQDVVDSIIEFINGLNLPQVVQTTLTFALTGIVTAIKLGGQFIGSAGYDLGLKLAAAVSEVHMDKYTLYDENGNPVDSVELPIKPTVDWTEHPVLALLFAGSDYSAKILVDVMTGGDYGEVQKLWDNWPEWLTFEGFGENVVTSFKALFEFDWLFGDGSAESGFLGAKGIVTWFKEDVIGIEDLAAWWNSSFLSEWFGEMDKETGNIKKKGNSNNSTGAAGGGNLMSAQMKSLVPSNDLLTKIQTGWSKIKGFINDPIGKIKEKITEVKKHINEKFNFENVKKSVSEKWEAIKNFFVGEGSFLYKIRTKITETKKHINEKFNFENVRKTVKEKWDKIKGYFVGDDSILTKIKKKFEDTKFKNPFEAITDAVESAKKAITGYDKQAAKSGWQSTQKVHVKGLAERLAEAFEGIVKALPTPIKDALKKVQDFINNLIDGINYLSGQLNKLKISGTNPFTGKAYSYGFSIPHIEHIKIPGLAQGAVIPPNKEFLALLGDQKQGTNIETPLDTMVDAFKIALAESGSTNHEPIVLQLNGRVVAQTVWDEEAKKYKQTGFGLAY